jgi:hypothetical protein
MSALTDFRQTRQSDAPMTPGEHSSSERKHTKGGPPAVRAALAQAAWNLRRSRPPDPISVWAGAIEQRRGTFTATVAVARKRTSVLFALWRVGSRDAPNHGVPVRKANNGCPEVGSASPDTKRQRREIAKLGKERIER